MVLGAGLAVVLYVALPPIPAEILYQLVAWGSVVAFFAGARRYGALGPAWLLIGSGFAVFALGDLVFTLNDLVWDVTSFPSGADAAYVSGYPLLAAGLATLVRRSRPGGDRIALIDAAIIVVPAAVIVWIWLVEPIAAGPHLSLVAKTVSAGYPLGDLVCLAVMVRLLTAGRAGINAHMPALAMLVCGFLAQLVADAWYMVGVLHGTYASGGWNDSVFLIPYIALAWAGLSPSMRFVDEPRGPQDVVLGKRRLAILTVAALITPSILLVQWVNGSALAVPLVISATAVSFLLVVTRMAELVRALECSGARHEYEATHDMLTGLPNRVAVIRRMTDMLASKEAGTLLFVDLDGFKQVNDSHGHFAGDDVLVAVAKRLRSCVRPSDLVGRLAGDEFVVVLDTANETAVYMVAERVVRGLDLEVESDFAPAVKITASVGLVSWRAGDVSRSAEGLIADADRAMYRAKTASGNQMAIGIGSVELGAYVAEAGWRSARLRVTPSVNAPGPSEAGETGEPEDLRNTYAQDDAAQVSAMARFGRRRAPRQAVAWLGRCRFGSSGGWIDCRVVDVSILGAAVEIVGFAPIGTGPLTVEIYPLAGEQSSVVLRCEVRNRRVGERGTITLGVEFVPALDEHDLARVGALLTRPGRSAIVPVHD